MVPPLFITETLRLRLSAHPEKKTEVCQHPCQQTPFP